MPLEASEAHPRKRFSSAQAGGELDCSFTPGAPSMQHLGSRFLQRPGACFCADWLPRQLLRSWLRNLCPWSDSSAPALRLPAGATPVLCSRRTTVRLPLTRRHTALLSRRGKTAARRSPAGPVGPCVEIVELVGEILRLKRRQQKRRPGAQQDHSQAVRPRPHAQACSQHASPRDRQPRREPCLVLVDCGPLELVVLADLCDSILAGADRARRARASAPVVSCSVPHHAAAAM